MEDDVDDFSHFLYHILFSLSCLLGLAVLHLTFNILTFLNNPSGLYNHCKLAALDIKVSDFLKT